MRQIDVSGDKLDYVDCFEGNVFFLKLLNMIGIKEGTRLYIFITTYRPLASDSPFTGISFDSTITFLNISYESFIFITPIFIAFF